MTHLQTPLPKEEQDFFDAIRGKNPAFILGTSSADKRTKYATLFNALGAGNGKEGKGVNALFTHIGALGITPINVPEKNGDYVQHAILKATALGNVIENQETSIRSRFQASGVENHRTIPLIEQQKILAGKYSLRIRIKSKNS